MTIPTDAWVKISTASGPNFSKDGTRIFHLRGTQPLGSGLPQVWVMDADGGNAQQLSTHEEKVATLRRAPNDDRLIWGIDAGGDERQQLWLLEPGGTPRALTAAPEVIHDLGGFSPDGGRIAYAANARDERYFDIHLMDLATGAVSTLVQGEGILTVPSWSSDGSKLTVIHDLSGGDQRLHVLDVATGALAEMPRPSPSRYSAMRWVKGEALLQGMTDHGGTDFIRLCRLDPATGACTELFAPPGRDVEAWSLSPDGTLLATIENDRGYALLRVGPADGDRPLVALPQGVLADLAWAPDSARLAFSLQGPTFPSGIWLWQNGTATPLVQPDVLADSGIDPASLVAPSLVEWPSFDGKMIPGWYLLPNTPPPPGGYPAVVWVHGGPSGQTRANFRPDIQLLLSQGFAVMMPNMRGSTGYGRAYMDSDELELRPHVLEDLAAGRAWLAAQPNINASRIGIMGQSYGGWVVLAATTLQPELWKAAVNFYGIADFVTLLERTGPWRAIHRAHEYGFPGTHDALFDRISPIRHVQNVTAPMLLLHGDRDPRVPMYESDSFTAAMEERQKKVRYERFTYAGHGFIRPDHRRRVYASVVDHFTTHL